ncbi:MAG: alpha-glucan family phosphorylase [Chloroflexota bacterium]
MHVFSRRSLPKKLDRLAELALDLRWTWSHEGDRFWNTINPEVWERTQNPWLLLQDLSRTEFTRLSHNPKFIEEFERLLAAREEHENKPGWFQENYTDDVLKPVAYFSMEFGLGEALPLYAGGLGILAGDYLKTASDLGVQLVGVGILYQEGYFRQAIDRSGRQLEAFPYNDPVGLPISQVLDASDKWLRIPVEFLGRTLWLRVWEARVGNVSLFLLDSNDPLNNPFDRSITNKLYPDRPESRLMQEMALGIGGWRTLKALGIEAEVCHINEGHAAFMVLERARDFMRQNSETFEVALCATRVGNVFTTHTPVAAGFDTYSPDLVAHYLRDYLESCDITLDQLLALGRKDPENQSEPLNMAYLAMHGSIQVNGVSRLHGKVSRRIFQPLFPHWPEEEVPVGYITNGVHMPSWDSQSSDDLWTRACGKDRWLHTLENLPEAINNLSDADLWALRTKECQALIDYVRQRLLYQLKQHGADSRRLKETQSILDPDTLTIGFARRFTAYKRPDLLLTDRARLTEILTNPERPVQLIVAGKAHPADEEGKELVQQFVEFAEQPDISRHVIFLEDYDISVAQQLVRGVDLWLNTPRRPWEACGTSGMKVLVNGGLNLSELDGWWAEAYAPQFGWAIGDGEEHAEPGWDVVEANQLYRLLENEIAPEFYNRDAKGIPHGWMARVRGSMSQLAVNFSSNRMLREYVKKVYIPATNLLRQRHADNGRIGKDICSWHTALQQYWSDLRFGKLKVSQEDDEWDFEIAISLGGLNPEFVRVELYADPLPGEQPIRIPMSRRQKKDEPDSYLYSGKASASRPAGHYTIRIIPVHSLASVPLEEARIWWQK